MKTFLFAIALILCFLTGFSQRKYDLIRSDYIYLKVGNRLIKPHDITKSNIQKLLGKPVKIKRVDNEISDAIVKEYVYPSASIGFEDNDFSDVDMRHTGWYFIFKTRTGFSKPFGIGTPAVQIKEYFPNAWAAKEKGGTSIWLTTAKGKPVDVYITFGFKNGKIDWILLTPNES